MAITYGIKDDDSLEWMQVQDDINKIKVPEYQVDLDARIKASEQGWDSQKNIFLNLISQRTISKNGSISEKTLSIYLIEYAF